MLTHEPTPGEIADWKRIYDAHHGCLNTNRKTGAELYAYLQSRYPLRPLSDPRADQVVIQNILQNESLACELPPGAAPNPVCCIVEPVGAGETLYREQDACFRGIENLRWHRFGNGLLLRRGQQPSLGRNCLLSAASTKTDLANIYTVAEYISCLERFGLLEQNAERLSACSSVCV